MWRLFHVYLGQVQHAPAPLNVVDEFSQWSIAHEALALPLKKKNRYGSLCRVYTGSRARTRPSIWFFSRQFVQILLVGPSTLANEWICCFLQISIMFSYTISQIRFQQEPHFSISVKKLLQKFSKKRFERILGRVLVTFCKWFFHSTSSRPWCRRLP